MKPRNQELGDKNLVGARAVEIRYAKKIKQRDLLTHLQLSGIEISATSLSRLEGQHRKISDYELVALANALCVDVKELLGLCENCDNIYESR